MLGKILCFFGLHKWHGWRTRSINYGYYDEEVWNERCCMRCRTIDIGGSSRRAAYPN